VPDEGKAPRSRHVHSVQTGRPVFGNIVGHHGRKRVPLVEVQSILADRGQSIGHRGQVSVIRLGGRGPVTHSNHVTVGYRSAEMTSHRELLQRQVDTLGRAVVVIIEVGYGQAGNLKRRTGGRQVLDVLIIRSNIEAEILADQVIQTDFISGGLLRLQVRITQQRISGRDIALPVRI